MLAPVGGEGEARAEWVLPYRPPLAWGALAEYLGARAIPGVEAVEAGVYRRTIRTGDGAGVVELERLSEAPSFRLRAPAGAGDAAERARRLLDLEADPGAIERVLGADPFLAPLIERRPGVRLPGAWEPFELAVRGIIGQQVSVRAATTIAGRVAAAFGEPFDGSGLTRLFPAPEALAGAELERAGLTRARAAAIRGLAAAVVSGDVSLEAACDPMETRARLVALPGIGPWTAEYVAMRALRDPDAFPASDLGLRYALAANGRPASAGETRARAEAWRPWRAYAAVHLWLSLADGAAP
ncbi:MAG: DNA-3-methyladenine glycosylase 2 family protein [Thermoleophilia bacterium]|nr:DNA-3-methyladenine glycosylase 2 family protein [Thermoleophilia bacterium]